MGYPKKYVGRYPNLTRWISSLGHRVYPYEMWCEPVAVKDEKPSYNIFSGEINVYETHYLYGLVDVVSYLNHNLWAWEYKSKKDSIHRGLKQVENYTRSFNFVCIVVADLAMMDRFVKAKEAHVRDILKESGVGIIWQDQEIFKTIVSPEPQKPNVVLNEALIKRFHRFQRSLTNRPHFKPEKTQKLTNYLGGC